MISLTLRTRSHSSINRSPRRGRLPLHAVGDEYHGLTLLLQIRAVVLAIRRRVCSSRAPKGSSISKIARVSPPARGPDQRRCSCHRNNSLGSRRSFFEAFSPNEPHKRIRRYPAYSPWVLPANLKVPNAMLVKTFAQGIRAKFCEKPRRVSDPGRSPVCRSMRTSPSSKGISHKRLMRSQGCFPQPLRPIWSRNSVERT